MLYLAFLVFFCALAWLWGWHFGRKRRPRPTPWTFGDEPCGFVPPTPGYAGCTRKAGHPGPCAHPFDEARSKAAALAVRHDYKGQRCHKCGIPVEPDSTWCAGCEPFKDPLPFYNPLPGPSDRPDPTAAS